MTPTARTLIRYPVSKWESQLSIEGTARTFKECLLSVAKTYLEDKNGIDTERMANSFIYEIYLDKVMFQKNEAAANFLKSDLASYSSL